MELLEITGGCFCGAVRYHATAPPMQQLVCHCANCRRATGAPSVAWVTFPNDSFSLRQGDLAAYRGQNGAVWTFCAGCGTTVTYTHPQRPEKIYVTVGSLDDPDAFPPTRYANQAEKLSWT
jgi:hypothetical protein